MFKRMKRIIPILCIMGMLLPSTPIHAEGGSSETDNFEVRVPKTITLDEKRGVDATAELIADSFTEDDFVVFKVDNLWVTLTQQNKGSFSANIGQSLFVMSKASPSLDFSIGALNTYGKKELAGHWEGSIDFTIERHNALEKYSFPSDYQVMSFDAERNSSDCGLNFKWETGLSDDMYLDSSIEWNDDAEDYAPIYSYYDYDYDADEYNVVELDYSDYNLSAHNCEHWSTAFYGIEMDEFGREAFDGGGNSATITFKKMTSEDIPSALNSGWKMDTPRKTYGNSNEKAYVCIEVPEACARYGGTRWLTTTDGNNEARMLEWQGFEGNDYKVNAYATLLSDSVILRKTSKIMSYNLEYGQLFDYFTVEYLQEYNERYPSGFTNAMRAIVVRDSAGNVMYSWIWGSLANAVQHNDRPNDNRFTISSTSSMKEFTYSSKTT